MKGKSSKKVEEYDAQDTTVSKEAKDTTDDFKKGGEVKGHGKGKKKDKKKDHRVSGEESKHRMDRPKRASGGRVGHSPFSSASKTSGGVGEDNHSKELPASDMNFNTSK